MDCPLTKVEFCTAIDAIQDYWDGMRKIEDIVGVVFSEGTFIDIIDRYIDTLCAVMKDEPAEGAPSEDIPWIMYYCWEKDFGRKYHDGDVMVDGEEFPLTNAEELYNLLIELYWKEEE